jgi:hypothetical protein
MMSEAPKDERIPMLSLSKPMNAELARALVMGRWGKYIAESLAQK